MRRALRITPVLILLALLPARAGAVEELPRVWVELPRSERVDEPADLPFPPAPNAAALERRARRGRPDRIELLSRGPSVEALRAVQATGARIVRISRWASSVSVEADATARRRLAVRFGRDALRPVATLRRSDPRIEESSGDLRRSSAVPGAGYGLSRAQITQIGIDHLHESGLTGEGLRVLVLDSGYRVGHPALADTRIEATWDFVNDDADVGNDPGEFDTQDRHGTGVLGVMGGFVEGDLVGVARDARYLLAKTELISSETRMEEDAFVAALEWGEALGADVMNASLGYRTFYDEPDTFAYDFEDLDGDTAVTTRAVDDLVALGVVAVTSAGNDGSEPGTLLTPADADSSLAIAAVDTNGAVTWFSSRGPTADGRIKPDLAALGLRVRWADTTLDGGTGWASGTSLSSPLVAGAVTLLLQAHPQWGPGEVGAALRATASQAQAPDTALGWGVIDAAAAAFDVEAPQVPLPFALREPAAGAAVDGDAVTFRWDAAEDLQTPGALSYRVEVGSVEGFTVPDAVFEAGPDTVRTVALAGAGTQWWRVVATDPDGHERASALRRMEVQVATGVPGLASGPWVRWQGPWPNPTAGSSVARLALDRTARLVAVEVFDLAGRRVRTLARDRVLGPGQWRHVWDGRDGAGRPVASGVYLLRGVMVDPSGERVEARTRITRVR